MKGKELIDFIINNALQNEELSVEYFSFERKEKFCGSCNLLVPLKDFHKGTSGADPDKSSCYRYICKACLNKAAFHKKYKKKSENFYE